MTTARTAINWFEIPVRNLLARVEAAGGRIASPKVQLPGDMGAFAHIVDTEGNRVGLHAA